MLPLAVVVDEVGPRSLGNFEMNLRGLGTDYFVWFALMTTRGICFDISSSLDHVAGDIEGVSWGFRDGETIVEGDAAGNGAKANHHPPPFSFMLTRGWRESNGRTYILSEAIWQTPVQAAAVLAVLRDSLKPAVTIKATIEAVN